MQHDDKNIIELALQNKLYARIPVALVINLTCASGTAAAFWIEASSLALTIWFGLMAASLCFRYHSWRQFQRKHRELDGLDRSRRNFTIGAGLTGCAWGLAALLFYTAESSIGQTFIPFILAGMVGGSLVVLTGSMPAFSAFLLGVSIPFAISLALIGGVTQAIMVILLTVYVLGVLYLARSATQSMIDSINLTTVNEQLINQLREKSSQLQATFDHVNQGVAVFDHLNRLITWNPHHRELHGYPIHLYRPGTHIRQFLEQDLARGDKPAEAALDPRALTEPLAPVHFQQSSADGRVLAVERNVMPGGGFVSTSTDITEHKRIEARMLYLAQHDPLTDLPNRLLFQDRLQQAMARSARSGSPLAVIMIDLDKFKQVNDSRGHRIGDQVLKAIAKRLRTGLRETDTVARMGGDEFAIVLPDLASLDSAIRIADKVRTRIDSPLKLGASRFDLHASFGMAIYPTDASDAESLLQFADFAMYEAKSEGGGGLKLASMAGDDDVPPDRAAITSAAVG